MDAAREAACKYYDERYDVVFQRLIVVGDKLELGDRANKRCRFCGKAEPEVTFKKVAHAISEALGNRGLISNYECDACNALFGSGIETDLGEWSKPARTFARIRGKRGIPTLKESSKGGWRIEYDDNHLAVKSYETNPIFVVDKKNKRVDFSLKRGSYTPVAVFKSFVKIGLTLLPEVELGPFAPALKWVRDTDHSRNWVRSATILHTFQNGPMPNDQVTAFVLRRKPGITDVPYAFLILGFGNDVYQVPLPAPSEETALNGTTFTLTAFPTPGGPNPARYGRAMPKPIDMTGTRVVRGEAVAIRMGYEALIERRRFFGAMWRPGVLKFAIGGFAFFIFLIAFLVIWVVRR
jgi:hypothetical protein